MTRAFDKKHKRKKPPSTTLNRLNEILILDLKVLSLPTEKYDDDIDMRDLFDRIIENKGPLEKWASIAEGYFVFPKLEGPISNRMKLQGKDVITWSVNDYLGLANLPEVIEEDAEAARTYGAAYPMGARMMSGHTDYHE